MVADLLFELWCRRVTRMDMSAFKCCEISAATLNILQRNFFFNLTQLLLYLLTSPSHLATFLEHLQPENEKQYCRGELCPPSGNQSRQDMTHSSAKDAHDQQ